ncbi:MAG: N-6 DNA methylase [Ectothiorhodospiraceae bacterium AqS1]|nr:N-6 DNA methylase [Ectothiorhodospiraceae bacterium AqS1]
MPRALRSDIGEELRRTDVSNQDTKSFGAFVWSIAEILRGDFKQSEYGKVILPFVVLRRLDCVLEDTKDEVLKRASTLPKSMDDEARDKILFNVVGKKIRVYNLSRFTFESLRGQDAKDIHENLLDYVTKFSSDVRDIFFDKFLFIDQIKRLNEADLLYRVFERFAAIDLHPKVVSNEKMGHLFEDLIRRFSEISNETAGEHFTPREVIRLIVSLLLVNDKDALTGKGTIRRIYDPAAGTGGMLSIAEEEMKKLNPKIRVELFGQELNPESFAILKSDMLMTGHNPAHIAFGNSLTEDAHRAGGGPANATFHYMLSNPPYGVNWDKYKTNIKIEAEEQGYSGRFGAGLPRVSDGQLLFLQHMISKMRDDEIGSRIGIVMNGSPLFTGGAGSGESEIRRWMLKNDWVEAIIALPTDIFYNTGIQTYIWLLTNRKTTERRGKVQLIDASGERFWQSLRKNLGSKRREISEKAITEITRIYAEMPTDESELGQLSKVFNTTDFGYREIRVERPLKLAFQITEEGLTALNDSKSFRKLDGGGQAMILALLRREFNPKQRWMDRREFEKDLNRALGKSDLKITMAIKKAILSALSERDEEAVVCTDNKGSIEPDSELRDHELVPLDENWQDYMKLEVFPFAPDAWVDESHTDNQDGEVGRVGYEINFNRYFYRYVPPRSLEEIGGEIRDLEAEIATLLKRIEK